jgi:hypothetical protein
LSHASKMIIDVLGKHTQNVVTLFLKTMDVV